MKEITTDLDTWIKQPSTLVWTKTADEILDKLKRYLTIIQQTSGAAH